MKKNWTESGSLFVVQIEPSIQESTQKSCHKENFGNSFHFDLISKGSHLAGADIQGALLSG